MILCLMAFTCLLSSRHMDPFQTNPIILIKRFGSWSWARSWSLTRSRPRGLGAGKRGGRAGEGGIEQQQHTDSSAAAAQHKNSGDGNGPTTTRDLLAWHRHRLGHLLLGVLVVRKAHRLRRLLQDVCVKWYNCVPILIYRVRRLPLLFLPLPPPSPPPPPEVVSATASKEVRR